jgi:predicted DNA-binding protein (UPF0251 family)
MQKARICALPGSARFGPVDDQGTERQVIAMTVDEFECIRLIDLEGLNQEGCARRMNVARTTAQAIYSSARAKLAECLVNGKELCIGGGDYVLCEDGAEDCPRHCGRHCREGGEDKTQKQ